MPDQEQYYRHYRELINEFTKEEATVEALPGLIKRIKQPSPKYGAIDHVNDALLKRGIGSGSDFTMVQKDKAAASASLMRFIRKPENLDSFQRLPDSQKQGIISMIKGGQ